MASRFFIRLIMVACVAIAALPAFAQTDIPAIYAKHLKISRDFTLKVADQMPEADYNFKLTPPQMSFAEQITHLAQSHSEFLSAFGSSGEAPGKPPSMKKSDVMAFVKKCFDDSIDKVSKLTPEQISKTYKADGNEMTGLELLMFMMDHTTHHRAQAEMYLRAKGITPAEYQF